MSTDYAEMEREFLSTLAADTGRDLAGWMSAISAQNLAHRNDIIDWLRQQGFMFSRASWLERIHHNGGRPIYLSPGVVQPVAAASDTLPAAAPASLTPTQPASPSAPSPPFASPPPIARRPAAASALPPWSAQRAGRAAGGAPAVGAPPPLAVTADLPAPTIEADLAAFFAGAKAYRPLGEHLLRRIREAVPDTRLVMASSCIGLWRHFAYGALAVSPRDVRLGLALLRGKSPAPFAAGRLPSAPASVAHVAVLTDAREVTPELMALVREAARCTD